MGSKVNKKKSLDDLRNDIDTNTLDKTDMDVIIGGKSASVQNPPCNGIVPQ